jgi:arginyl-tRNA synthetase
MLKIKDHLFDALVACLEDLGEGLGAKAAFESPKMASHGDLAVTAALSLSKALKTNPRDLALRLKEALSQTPAFKEWVQSIEIAGPGFLNLSLKPSAKQAVVSEVLTASSRFGEKAPRASRVLVEFVSANPTGPLHVGHARQAALGDALCNLFETQGLSVHREFYYNDAGVQIDTLANSTWCRIHGIEPGHPDWPEQAYQGDYIADIAKAYLAKERVKSDDREVSASGDPEDMEGIKNFAVAYLRREQDLDLSAFALKFDEFYLESSLYTSARVEKAVSDMVKSGHTYEQDGALWLKSTDFGDDKDRVMRKSEGGYTYFVPDVAYHLSKWERGFEQVINIQGTDHHGTIARVRAGLQAVSKVRSLGIPLGYPQYVLHTMVRVMKGGQEVKISKRAGSYVTLRDLIEWTSRDAVRFFLLSRKPDTEYLFDVDLAVAKNNDNPVYYVQYAHARICSILMKEGLMQPAREDAEVFDVRALGKDASGQLDFERLLSFDVSPLESEVAQHLMLILAKYPDVLEHAAQDLAPHDVTFYLRELAASYHSYYDQERILVEEVLVKEARLALISAVAQVLRCGLHLLGVSAPLKM